MFRYFFVIFLFVQPVFADDLFNILDSKETSKDLNIAKRTQALRKLIKHPTKHQEDFFRLMGQGKMKRAFYQWPQAFGKTSFSESDNGRALYGYLLFKNGLPLAGLDILFSGNPGKMDSLLIRLWQSLMQLNLKIWTVTNIQWSDDWVSIFGLPAKVRIMVRQFDREYTLTEFEELLRKTSSGSWERHWGQWRYIATLLMNNEDIKAAKLLKYLQGITENNPVSMDLMNLTAARMLYQNAYLTESIRYYKKVKKGSDYWFEALEEMGWAELRLGHPQNSLAYTQTLLNPDFGPDVGPGAFYLASLASLKICDYQGVLKTIREFKNRFRAKAKGLLDLKKQPETPAVKNLFSQLTERRISNLDLGVFAGKLPRHIAHDEGLYFLLQRQNQLEREAEVAEKLYSQFLNQGVMTKGFQTEMGKFKNKIIARNRKGYSEALERVKTLSGREIMEISKTLKRMQIVEAELIQQISLAEKRSDNGEKSKKTVVKKGTTGVRGKHTVSFIHKGERWYDELSRYQVSVKRGCGSKGTL